MVRCAAFIIHLSDVKYTMYKIVKISVDATAFAYYCVDASGKPVPTATVAITQAMIDAFWESFYRENPPPPQQRAVDGSTVHCIGHMVINRDGTIQYAVYPKQRPTEYWLSRTRPTGLRLKCPRCDFEYACAEHFLQHWDCHANTFTTALEVTTSRVADKPIQCRWYSMLRSSYPCDFLALMKEYGIVHLTHTYARWQRVYLQFADDTRVTIQLLRAINGKLGTFPMSTEKVHWGANDPRYQLCKANMVKYRRLAGEFGNRGVAPIGLYRLEGATNGATAAETRKRPADAPMQSAPKRRGAVFIPVCTECELKCVDPGSLLTHTALCHTAGPHQCGICQQKYDSVAGLTTHYAAHVNGTTSSVHFTCAKCRVFSDSQAGYEAHIKRVHIEPKEEPEKAQS